MIKGGGGKWDGKASEVCVHALVLFYRTLPPCVPVTPPSAINATPPPCCVSGGADSITADVKIHLGKRPLVAGDDDSKEGGGGTISSK